VDTLEEDDAVDLEQIPVVEALLRPLLANGDVSTATKARTASRIWSSITPAASRPPCRSDQPQWDEGAQVFG
jgi:hypothetical protein